MTNNITQIARQGKQVAWQLASLTSEQKNHLLLRLADLLEQNKQQILQANQQDLEQAKQQNLASNLLARLGLTPAQLEDIIAAVRAVAGLADPVSKILEQKKLPSGLELSKISVPLGLVAVIYESRPNVTIDVVTLCIKAGNAVILRGGREALNSNKAMLKVITQALIDCNLPSQLVQLIEQPERSLIDELLAQGKYIDLLIPRGGEKLQQLCVEKASMPVITGGIGVCHIYVDKTVDQTAAIKLIDNAKTQNPSVCNAVETLLVHRNIAQEFLPKLVEQLTAKQVVFHADEASYKILSNTNANVQPLQLEQLCREWLTLDLNICLVDSLSQAIAHIKQYGSLHSEVVLTDDDLVAKQFVNLVDAAAVYINASSRFTDGSQFGLGSEVAVSTQKTHPRGPMGLESLVTYKWLGVGQYLVRK